MTCFVVDMSAWFTHRHLMSVRFLICTFKERIGKKSTFDTSQWSTSADLYYIWHWPKNTNDISLCSTKTMWWDELLLYLSFFTFWKLYFSTFFVKQNLKIETVNTLAVVEIYPCCQWSFVSCVYIVASLLLIINVFIILDRWWWWQCVEQVTKKLNAGNIFFSLT